LTRGFHGGNRDNFTPRADCNPDDAGLPSSVGVFLDRVDRSIRNTISEFACGSSRYTFFKQVRIAENRMSFVPTTYLDPSKPTGYWIGAEWAPLSAIPLERWSYASVPNHVEFNDFIKPRFLQARA